MSYNYLTQYNSPNYTSAAATPRTYGMNRTIEGITIHHWGDPNHNPQFQGIVNYLCRANGDTSAHYVATGTGRQVACIVSPADTAWHAGTAWGNAKTIGIELDPRARDEDYDVAAELVADIRSAYGDVPIYWHSYFVATACPGRWNAERLDKLSYTKYSHATEWGKGGNKQTAPVPTPTPTPTPEPVKEQSREEFNPTKVFKFNKEARLYSILDYKVSGTTVYPKGETIAIKQKITLSNGNQWYRTEYSASKEIGNGFRAEDLIEIIPETPAPIVTEPSPTVDVPGTGTPVADKPDYEERISALEKIVKTIVDFLSNLFKGFNK